MGLNDVQLAIVAAEAGAAVVRSKYGHQLTRFEKSPSDFATDADIEAERAILDRLRAARPDDRFVGEESGASAEGSSGRTWLVDPLCGTLNFAAHTPLVSVNVAARLNGQTVAAVSADPFGHELFWTAGSGAFRRVDGRDEPLRPSAASSLVDVNLDPPYPNGDRFRAVELIADPDFAHIFRARVLSTTLALAWVAAGRHAGYVTDGRLLGNVHFASGIALCQAAGCPVTGLQGQPLHTGLEGLIAAADDETHTALVRLVGRQLRG